MNLFRKENSEFMTGIFLEIKTICEFCGEQIAVNALVFAVKCNRCGNENSYPAKLLREVLVPAIRDILKKPESFSDEKNILYITKNFKVRFGLLMPMYKNSSKSIPVELIQSIGDSGFIENPDDLAKTFVRKVPEEFQFLHKHLKYIIGEDWKMIPMNQDLPKEMNFIESFNCLNCGSTLKIKGDSRQITCSYCSSNFLLPDEIWMKLHPTSIPHPWYLWIEPPIPEEFKLEADSIYDIATDQNSHLYILYKKANKFHLVSITKDFKLRWEITDFSFEENEFSIQYKQLLFLPNVSELYVYNHKEYITVVSTKTGKEISRIHSDKINLENLVSFTTGSNGTILTIEKRKEESNPDKLYEFIRYDKQFEKINTWQTKLPEEKGLFQKLKKVLWKEEILNFEQIQDCPEKLISDDELEISYEKDNYYYIRNDKIIKKYNQKGKQIYSYKMDSGEIQCISVDKESNLFILYKKENLFSIASISKDGLSKKIILESIPKEIHFDSKVRIEVLNEWIYVFSSNGKWQKYSK